MFWWSWSLCFPDRQWVQQLVCWTVFCLVYQILNFFLPCWKWFSFDKKQYYAAYRLLSLRLAFPFSFHEFYGPLFCVYENILPYQGFHNKLLSPLQNWLVETYQPALSVFSFPSDPRCVHRNVLLLSKVRITWSTTCYLLSLSYPVHRETRYAFEFFLFSTSKSLGGRRTQKPVLSICSPNCVWAAASLHSCHRLDYSVKKSSPYVKETDQTSQLSSIYF